MKYRLQGLHPAQVGAVGNAENGFIDLDQERERERGHRGDEDPPAESSGRILLHDLLFMQMVLTPKGKILRLASEGRILLHDLQYASYR